MASAPSFVQPPTRASLIFNGAAPDTLQTFAIGVSPSRLVKARKRPSDKNYIVHIYQLIPLSKKTLNTFLIIGKTLLMIFGKKSKARIFTR